MSSEMPVWLTTVLAWEAKVIAVFAAAIMPFALGVILVGIYKLTGHSYRDWQRKREARAWYAAIRRAGIGMPHTASSKGTWEPCEECGGDFDGPRCMVCDP
jgi:hypothetical protein